MLVISRTAQKPEVVFTLPDGRTVRVLVILDPKYRGRVQLGIDAPRDVHIHRAEQPPPNDQTDAPEAPGGT